MEGYQIILKRSCRPLAFISFEAFLKNKKRSGTSLSASFSAWFSKKNSFLVIFYNKNIPNFIFWLPLIREILRIMCIEIVFNQVVTSWNLKLTLSFSSSRFFYITKNQDKNLNILKTKRAFKMKLKAIFITFKGLPVTQTKIFFGRW